MSDLKYYDFDLFHRDVEPVIKSSNLWGVQGNYIAEANNYGYTNWLSDGGVLQSAIPSGEDVVMRINGNHDVELDVDVVAYSVVLGDAATLNLSDNHSMHIVDGFTINGLMSVRKYSLTNAVAAALQLNGSGRINLSGNGSSGTLGTEANRNAFAIGKDLTVTTLGYTGANIYANLINAGTITTESGSLTLSGNTIDNTGTIVTGGQKIYIENATVNSGILSGANGELQLNGVIANNVALTGTVRATENNCTLNQVSVDDNGELSIETNAIAQGFLTINGKVNVWSGKNLYSTSAEAVTLNGCGTLNLSGNGSSGSLGTEAYRNAFTIDKDLTITTIGYTGANIYANITNEGTITTSGASLTLSGNTIENNSKIITGGQKIYIENATVNSGTLNGANGELQLNGVVANNVALTGSIRVTENSCTLNQVSVDETGELSIQASVEAQESLTINGKVNVWSGKSIYNASAESAVALTGNGILNLSGNGSSGSLGMKNNKNAFTIGKDLTLTTLGYTGANIYANITNEGTITTESGSLTLSGNTIENAGSIFTGGNQSITLQDAILNGNGTLDGKSGTVYLNNSTLTDTILKGVVRASEKKSTLKNISFEDDCTFTTSTDIAAQDTLAINGTVSVQSYSYLANEKEDTVVKLTGTGTLNLSSNGTWGALGSEDFRNAFTIGKDLTLTTQGYSSGYIYANITNEGLITTEAGAMALNGITVENSGSIVTGGQKIYVENTTVNGGILSGANGELLLNGSALNNAALSGAIRINGETDSTLNHVSLAENSELTIQASSIAQETFAIDGTVNVQSYKSLYSTSAEAVALTGTGKLNLSSNGTWGSLGTESNRNAFTIGKDLTLTTQGYSSGYIYANITNEGLITTEAGAMALNGITVENSGSIVTGGQKIYVENTTVNGGILSGANGELLLNGSALNNAALSGTIRATDNLSTLNQVTLSEGSELAIQALVLAQGTFTINGKVNVWSGKNLYSTSEEAVALTGTGTLNLSGNGSSGALGTEEFRNAFTIGKDLTLTTFGYSTGYIYANITNEGVIVTNSGCITLKGSTIENIGSIVTGGQNIYVENSTLSGSGVLNGKKGTVYLINSSLTEAILKGETRASDSKSTMKNVTLDVDCKFTMTTNVALQESLAINGTMSVHSNSHLVNESADTVVKLTGDGTLNLSGNGSSGYLGGNETPGGFEFGEGLTLTTFGYSSGKICANLKNNGLITTSQGYLDIFDCTVENKGNIQTGGRGISVSNATITGDGVLDGADGTITLENATLDSAVLKGALQAKSGTALNGVAVTADARLDVTGLSTTSGILLDGWISVTNGAKLLSSGDEEVAIIGTGTIGLSGNGSNGYLGDNNSKFSIGEGLTVTTQGYSAGYIYADMTNHGEITTDQGELIISGADEDQLSFRNQGTIRSGGRAITFTKAAVNNVGGSIFGESGTVYVGTGATVTGGTLGGKMQVSGEGASVVLDKDDCIRDGKITVSGKGTLTARNLLAQGDINVGNEGTLELSNVALAGKVDANSNLNQLSMAGVNGIFELVLNSGYASRYTIVGNDFTDATVTIQGNGNIDLSGNYWGGLTDEAEIRAKYGLGDSVSVGNALTAVPEGNALFLTGAELANEKYLSLAQENLKLNFLSNLDPESITEQTVQLWDDTTGEQVSLADSLPSVEGKQLVFDNGLFEDEHSYHVVLSDGIHAVDGSALNTTFKDSVAFIVDHTAPKVLNIEKTVNLTGKLPDFRITFSSEVNVAALSKALRVISPDEQDIGVQVEMLTDRVALVTSQNAINVPGEYTVSIDAAKLTDKAGNYLQDSFVGVIEMTRINLDIKELAVSKDSVAQGETFTVQWQTFNQEEADLYGNWTDGVYLSKDNLWDTSDTLIASVGHNNGLQQGTSVSGQAQITLSGVVDGDYYLLVRPDIYNEKPTGASERNVKSVAVSVTTDALPDGAQTIRSGQSSTYKFTAEAGTTYQLTLDTLRDDYNGMEIYVGYGYAPTRENYDTAVRNANDAQVALASRNYDQDIYVMVYARNSGSNIGYTLAAEKVGLEITAVSPGVQNIPDGQVLTFVVDGLCFTPDTTVAAIDAAEQAAAGVVTYVNDHQLLLTFEPGQLGEGDYVLKATDGEASALSETITLTTAGAPNLEVTADLPQRIGNHLITSFDVNYANTGNASMGAVLLTVNIYEVDNYGNKTRSVGIMGMNKTVEQNHKAYSGSYSALPTGYVSTATIYAQGKVPGQLEAGASGSVSIDLVGLLQPWNTNGNNNLIWEINYFDENSTEVLNWQETMPGNSAEFYSGMEKAVGTTWGDYVKMLHTNAQTLQGVGADTSNATDLLQLTVQTVSGNLNPYAAIEGVTDLSVATTGTLSLEFSRFFSNNINDRGWHTNWEYSLVKESNDAVTFFSPELGVYTFRKDAYGKYFCENSTDVTLTFKGSQAILQDTAWERTWTMDQVDAQNWRLAQISDTRGNSIKLSYDKDGNLSKLASSDGEFILVTKDGLTGSNGIHVTYERSDAGQLTGVAYNDDRNPLSYQYEGDTLTGVLKGGELVSSYKYDENGAVVQATQGNLVTTVTTEQAGVITVTDNCDHSFTSVYYADGNLARLTDNVSGSWNYYTYDANGNIQTMTCSSGTGESYVLNANGNVIRRTDAYGNTYAYTYFKGHVKTVENSTGYAVNISYDQDWNVTEYTCSDDAVITFSYDETGKLTGITNPLGYSMTFAYDDSRHISTVTFGDYSADLTYDSFGNIASVTQNGHTISYEYNTRGLLTSLTDANGNQAQITYDGNDCVTEAVFADGSKQSWGYDTTGNMVSCTTRAGDVIAYQWSADGALTGTEVAGAQYQYTYNSAGLLTAAIGADSVQSLSCEYNTHGDLTGLTYKDGTAIAIERDAAGNIASYTIGGQTFAYTWQGGEMTSVSVNGNAFTSYTRNAEGILTGGNGIDYEYNAINDIVKVGGTEYTYNNVSQIVRKTMGEEIWTYTYDLDGNLTGEMLGDGTAFLCTYTYDAAGNRLTKKDVVADVTTTWTYGEMNQVLTVKAGSDEAVEYSYDLNGNLLSDGHAAYTWTQDSRMASMTVGETTWTYTYNALGDRDSASNGVDTFTFCYDGSGNLLAQYKNGEAYQFYIMGATGIEGYVDAEGAVYTFTYDLGGNVTAVSGSNGKSATYTYDAFGNIIGQTGDIRDNALTWHGHFGTLLNPDGSYYVQARNYSAADGRFISTDPSFFCDGANLYSYAYNDPVNYIDLDGMKGDPTSLPTSHPKGTFLYNLTHLEEKFPALNEKLNNADLKSNLPKNAPRIGSGQAPGIFKAMEKWVGKATPKGSGFGQYYSNGFKLAEKLYKDGTISTPDGTMWPPSYDHYYNTDKYIHDLYERFILTTDKDEQLEIIQKAKMRKDYLEAKEEAEKAKTQGGTNATSANTQSASSYDPNDKLATEGATDLHLVQNGSRLEYTVLFENDPDNATAPARKVYVRDVMDSNLDLGTFQLHSFTLAGYTYQLPEGRDSFNDNVILDLGDAEITVAVAINLDTETRELTASFTAIDPETGFELQDLTKGVLLVNDESGRGEGNFNYSIKALSDLPSNTEIKNTAEIFFDFNDPIKTPTTLNTIDAAVPTVSVTPSTTAPTNQDVTLTAVFADDVSLASSLYKIGEDGEWTAYPEDGVVVSDNNTTVYFKAVDAVGHESEVAIYEVTNIDKEAPEKPAAVADVTETTNGEVLVSATFSEDSVIKEYSLDGENWQEYTEAVKFTENGTVYFRGTDAAGNPSDTTTYEVTNIDAVQDSTKPTVSDVAANITDPTNQDVIVTAVFADDIKLASSLYRIGEDGEWTAYPEGGVVVSDNNTTVYFKAVDAAGLESDVVSYEVTNIDKDAPVITLAGDNTTPLQVSTLRASTEDGVDIFYSTDNENWTKYEGQLDITANGTYYFRATDAVGNTGTSSFVFENIDTVPPEAPTVTASTTEPTHDDVLVTATFSEDSVTKEYSLDGHDWKAYTGPISFSMNGTVFFRGTDAAGNVSEVATYEVANIVIPDNKPDDGKNDYLYNKKLGWNDANIQVTNTITGNGEINLDSLGSIDQGVYHNMFGNDGVNKDTGDVAKIDVETAAKLTFTIDSTAAGTFYVYEDGKDKKGIRKQIQVGKVAVKAGQTATLKDVCLTADGNYYVAMLAKNVNKAGAEGLYNVSVTSSTFFVDADNGGNDTAAKGQVISVGRGTTAIVLDSNEMIGSTTFANFVGFGDSIDYAKLDLASSAYLSFSVKADGAAKFIIWKQDAKGKLSKVSTTTLTAKNGFTATTKAQFLDTGKYTYYVSMESTTATKGGSAYYNVELGGNALFFDSADGGLNNVLYDKKAKAFKDDANFVTTEIFSGSQGVSLDDNAIGNADYGNFVGYGDAVDYARIELTSGGSLSFDLKATGDATFSVYRKTEKKGKLTLETIQTTKLTLAKNTSVVTTTTNVLTGLKAGEYYVSMTAKNTKASDKGSVFYNVTANAVLSGSVSSALAMPEMELATSSLSSQDALSFGQYDTDALANASSSALNGLDDKTGWTNIASLA